MGCEGRMWNAKVGYGMGGGIQEEMGSGMRWYIGWNVGWYGM